MSIKIPNIATVPTYNTSYFKIDGDYLELLPLRLKAIPNFPAYYASEDGRVFSTFGSTFREMKPTLDRYGYLKISLFKEGKRYDATIHRLIATTYVPNVEERLTVNHKDGVKINNHYLNLEWMNPDENTSHATMTGLQPTGINNGNSKFSDYTQVRAAKEAVLAGFENKQIADYFKISRGAIGEIRRGVSYRNISPIIPDGFSKTTYTPATKEQEDQIFALIESGISRVKVNNVMREFLSPTAIRHVFKKYDEVNQRTYIKL